MKLAFVGMTHGAKKTSSPGVEYGVSASACVILPRPPHLVVVGVGIAVVADAEARLEVHVGHQPQARHQEEDQQQPPPPAVAPPLGEEPAEAQHHENQGAQRARYAAERAGPLPVEVLEVSEQLEACDRQRAPRIVRAVGDRGIVQGRARGILGAPDHGQQGVERVIERDLIALDYRSTNCELRRLAPVQRAVEVLEGLTHWCSVAWRGLDQQVQQVSEGEVFAVLLTFPPGRVGQCCHIAREVEAMRRQRVE
jgi:hypothetical protein